MRTGLAYIAITVLGGSCLWPAAAAEPSAGGNQGRIVFSSNRSGPWRIWSVQPDGSALAELTKAGADEQDVDPCFSPDGKLILFTSTRGGATGVWTVAADGSKARRICDGDQAEWSPDGKRIVLRRKEQILTRELAGG